MTILKRSSGFLLYAILFISLIIFQNCSDDPSSPPDEDPITQDPVTIGPEGGTIENNDIKLTIPAGAFSENHDVVIEKIVDDGEFGESSVTDSYQISGIPDKFNQSIKVKLKYNGVAPENNFIAVGRVELENSSLDSSTVYELFPATDSTGYLIASIPQQYSRALSKETSTEAYRYRRVIRGVTRMNTYNTEHFKIEYPWKVENSHIFNLAAALEDSYKIVNEDLNFALTPTTEPISILVKYGSSTAYKIGSKINVKTGIINSGDLNKIRTDVGPLLLEIGIENIFNVYETFGYPNSNYYWLEEAIITWSEELFTLDQSFQYPERFYYVWSPFNGLRFGAEVEDIYYDHGNGLASVIKYLVDNNKLKTTKIADIFTDIGNGTNPTEALLQNVDGNSDDWWPDFFKEYVSGNIYGIHIQDFLDESLEWNINSKEDTLVEYSYWNFLLPDLSAELFSVNLNYVSRDAASNMLFTPINTSADNMEGLSLLMFGVSNQIATYFGKAHENTALLENLAQYYDNNTRKFLVVLVNSKISSPNDYLGAPVVDLKIEVNTEGSGGSSDLDYNSCFIEVYVVAQQLDTRYSEENQNYTIPVGLGTENEYDYDITTIKGSFTGNTFTGSFDSGEGQTSTATVRLSDDHDMVLEYSWAEVDTSLANLSTDIRSVSGVSGTNIPLKAGEEAKFELRGTNACSGVSTLLDFTKYEEERFGTVYADSSQVIGFTCDENSRVVIRFSKE